MHNYLARIKKLQEIIKKEKVSAVLVTNKTNILYLSGFAGSNGFILITKQKSILFTDGRYIEEARYKIPRFFKLVDITKMWKNPKDLKREWQKTLKNLKIKSLGFEGDSITVNGFKKYKNISKKIKFKDIGGKIETLRAIKDPYEISLIKKSQKINEKVFLEIEKLIKAHITQNKVHIVKNETHVTAKTTQSGAKTSITNKTLREIDLVWEIKKRGFEYGAESLSFEPIVSFGKHTSQPHHESDKTKLKKGDIVLIDMGMKYKRYCSDMTRMIFTSKPTKEQFEVYSTVLQAQKNAIDQIKSGISEQKIDSTARDHIKSKKYGKFFTHGTGHGVGLDIHESPSLSENSAKIPNNKTDQTHKKGTQDQAIIKQGMIMTIEPGIYLPEKFGIRLEDMILVTRTRTKNLTKIKKINPLCAQLFREIS